MTTLEIQLFLDELTEKSFLEAILEIKTKEREYKGTDFFKTTKIPLMTLYEKYLQYTTLSADRVEELALAIESMDLTRFSDQLANLILQTLDNNSIQEKIEGFTKDFDLEKLIEQNEDLEELIDKLKE